MNHFLCLLLIELITLTLASGTLSPTDPRLLIIIAGESNSGGYALNSDATSTELAPRNAVKILNNATLTFQTLQIGRNNLVGHYGLDPTTTHGVELELANQAEKLPADCLPIFLVKTGQGGSKICQWASGGAYFDTFRERVTAAKKLLIGQQVRPVVLISLGINDAIACTPIEQWKLEMNDLVWRLRKEVGGEPPIIMTQFMPRYAQLNSAINQICAEVPSVYSVDTRDVSLRDANHWDYAGMKLVARRILDVIEPRDLFPPHLAQRHGPQGVAWLMVAFAAAALTGLATSARRYLHP